MAMSKEQRDKLNEIVHLLLEATDQDKCDLYLDVAGCDRLYSLLLEFTKLEPRTEGLKEIPIRRVIR